MVDQRLVDYIKSELSRGASLQQIKQNLISHGWLESDINEAVSLAIAVPTTPMYTMPTTPMYKELIKKTSKQKTSKLWIIPVLVIIVVIGGVFAFFMFGEKEITPPEIKPPAEEPIQPTESKSPTEEPIKSTEPIDCGTDLDCFIQAAANCNLAKVTHTATINFSGIKQTTTSFWEIKGRELNKCIFYLRTEKIDLTFPPEVPQNVVEQQKEIYKKLEGRDGTCKFNTNDLAAMLSRWKEGNYNGGASCTLKGDKWECTYTGDWAVAEDCQGTYFSQKL